MLKVIRLSTPLIRKRKSPHRSPKLSLIETPRLVPSMIINLRHLVAINEIRQAEATVAPASPVETSSLANPLPLSFGSLFFFSMGTNLPVTQVIPSSDNRGVLVPKAAGIHIWRVAFLVDWRHLWYRTSFRRWSPKKRLTVTPSCSAVDLHETGWAFYNLGNLR